jgi:hypothetical protein
VAKKPRKKKAKRAELDLETPQDQPNDEQPETAAEANPAGAEPEDGNELPPAPKPHEGPAPEGVVNGIVNAGRSAAKQQAPQVSETPLSPLEEMVEIETEYGVTESKLIHHQSEINACKALLKALTQRMRECVRRAKDGATRDLFADPPQTPLDAPKGDADPDAWRAAPIASLDIPKGMIRKLTESGISTVGKLADWTAEGNPLDTLKGIGPAAAERIIDASIAFHVRRAPAAPSSKASQNAPAPAGA